MSKNVQNWMTGFGNHFSTEVSPGILPVGQNAPQHLPDNCMAEQINGSAFTQPRADNLRSWLYRKKPSVAQSDYCQAQSPTRFVSVAASPVSPQALRWSPLPIPQQPCNLIESLTSYCLHSQAHIMLYACNRSMDATYFASADGEWLIVPESGEIILHTEMGIIPIAPAMIAVIPRGIKWRATLKGDRARGYIIENQGQPFRLPALGPIGANGLANPRDFEYPQAAIEDSAKACTCITKFKSHFWETQTPSSPLNVLAWHGNYAPYRYDLRKFNTINTVSYDHPDPSIFTVLTSPTAIDGIANIDFVIFPARWMVAEHSFRPPYFHRNIMNEFMGLIAGTYDAKSAGFNPGGASLHPCMTPHGPDVTSYQKAIVQDLKPQYLKDSLAFMFESNQIFAPTTPALESSLLQRDYTQCWQGF